MTLSIGDAQIPYRVEKARGKKTRLVFKGPEAILCIRTPSGKLDPHTQQFIHANEQWILKHYQQQRQHQQTHVDRRNRFHAQIQAGTIPYLGKNRRIHFLRGTKRQVKLEEEEIHLTLRPQDREEERIAYLYSGLRVLAKEHLTRRTRELAQMTQSRINQIRVKDHKSKWGSCSNKSNINLNWHLILLNPALIDYVIIHELMHLREMNHSPRFWQWVERFYPSYKEAEKQLKAHGWLIGIMNVGE